MSSVLILPSAGASPLNAILTQEPVTPPLNPPHPSELTAHRRSLKPLTGIRFFAALYVVIFHTRVAALLLESGHRAAGNFFTNGFLAVPLFFLLSGFILAYTYCGQIETLADHRRFWEARFARIWPVYMLSLLLSSIPSFTFPPPARALAAVFMVQAWNPLDIGLGGVWNLVCWTLSVEALFYLVFPFLQTALERLTPRLQLAVALLFIALCVLLNTSARTLGYPAEGPFRFLPLAVCHLPEFFTGVALGNLFLHHLTFEKANRSANPRLFGSGLFTWFSAALTLALLCRSPGPWTSLVVAAFSLLIFGLAAERTLLSRLLSTPLMLLGGGISYSVYLMQMPVKSWVNLVLDRLHLASDLLRMTLSTLVLLLVSLLLFKGVEDPARKLLRTLFAHLEKRRNPLT